MSTDSLDCTTSAELSNSHDHEDTLHESAEENVLPHLDTLESGGQNGTHTSQAIALPSSPTLTDELKYYMLCCKEYGKFCPNTGGASCRAYTVQSPSCHGERRGRVKNVIHAPLSFLGHNKRMVFFYFTFKSG
jgi:hypothetical protein